MNPPAIMTELNRLGVAVTTDGDRLRIDAPIGCITDELRTAIFSCKAGLIAILTKPTLDTYADREWARFISVAEPVPGRNAWRDPGAMLDRATRAAVAAMDESAAPPAELPDDLKPFADPSDKGSLGYRIHLAKVCCVAVQKQENHK